jgi:hypothetical protein
VANHCALFPGLNNSVCRGVLSPFSSSVTIFMCRVVYIPDTWVILHSKSSNKSVLIEVKLCNIIGFISLQ